MTRRFSASALALLLIAACVYAGVGASGANLSAAKSNLGSVTAGDWVAPAVTLTTPSANARVDAAGKPTFSGAAGTVNGDLTTVTVRIYNGVGTGGTQAQALPVAATGATWSTAPSIALPDGIYTAQAEQGDGAGNLGKSSAVTFTVDRTAPAPTVTSPTGSVQTPVFTGTAGNATGDASTVTVTVTKTAGAPVTYSGTRTGTTWTATVPTLTEGDYTVTVSQSDDLSHTGSSSAQSFTVDRTAPVVTVTAPTAASATNVSTPTFSGARGTATGDAAAVTVRLYAGAGTGGTLLQTRAATVTGSTWSVASASSLADGTYTVQASQADAAANTGTSTAITFTVDTAAPSPTIGAPTGYTGATPALSGTAGNATGDATTVTVEILSGASVVQTLTPTRTGTAWSTTATSALAQGAYTARVRQSDSAGNAGLSSSVAFSVDTVAPTVAVTAPAAGSFTNSATPTLSGTAGTAGGDLTAITVKVYSGASTAGTLLQTRSATAAGGTWSVAATTLPSNGQYTVQATQADAAGNTGTSTAITFTYDTVAPAAPAVTAPTTWATTRTPTITGTAANGTGDNATVTVEILSGVTVVQTLSATRTGTTWSVVVPVALTEGGAYTARARQGDAAGNTSANSAALGFTVDSIAPVVTLVAPANASYTNITTPTLSGAAGTAANDLATITVRIYNSGGTLVQTRTATAAAGAWSVATSPALAQGTYTAQASQSDSAGNTGTSTTNTFTVDTTAPTAANVTTTNVAGGTVGQLDAGDSITFTYSEAMDPASIVTGWNGTGSQSVTLNWTNAAGADWFSITNAGSTVHLSSQVAMNANFLKKNWTTTGTLTQTSATTFKITLDQTPPNNVAGNGTAPGANIAWTPDTGGKDLAGNAVTSTAFTQTGNGVDF